MPKFSPRDRKSSEKALRDRVPLTDAEKRLLGERSANQAFWISDIHDLRLVDDALKSLARAVRDEEDFKAWKKKEGRRLRSAWGPGARDKLGRVFNQGHRLQTIFRNASMHSYNSSRFLRMRHPSIVAIRPFWRYEVPRPWPFPAEICTRLNKVIRPATDAFWNTRVPPLHHRCHGVIKTLTAKQAARAGGPTPNVYHPPTKPPFGEAPSAGSEAVRNIDLSGTSPAARAIFERKSRRHAAGN